MAAPTFGFSVGDFIAAIELAIEVYKACRETGGAESESKRVLVELRAYIALLQRLQGSPNETSKEIGELVSVCQIPVQEFCAKMERKWECCNASAISRNSIKNTLRSAKAFLRKVDWALFDAEEVERLKTQIAPPLSAIVLLLALELRYSRLNYLCQQLTGTYRSSQSGNNTMVVQKLNEIESSNLRNETTIRLLSRNLLKVQEDYKSMMQGYYQQNIARRSAVYDNFEDLRTQVQKMIDSAPPLIAQKPEARTPNMLTGNNINVVGDVQTCGEAFLLLYETRLLLGSFALMPHLDKDSAPDSPIPWMVNSNVSTTIISRSNADHDAKQKTFTIS